MKKLFKKSIAVLLTLAMLVCYVPIIASAETYSGTCGDNLTWSLDTQTGVLEINGEGEMTDTPWISYSSYIKSVNISNSVTSISSGAFENCYNLETLMFPMVDSIEGSLYYGKSASKIKIADGEVLVKWTEDDQTTQLEFGADFANFELFDSINGACGLVESISLDEANTSFKLIDGVLYNNDVTTLLIYPTASSKTEYIMPDTVENEYDYLCEVEVNYIAMSTSLISAKNLKNVTYGASFGKNIAEYLRDTYSSKFQNSTSKGEKIGVLINMAEDASSKLFGYCIYHSSNRLENFQISSNNPYFKDKEGMFVFPFEGYDIIVKTMLKHIERYELEGKDIVGGSDIDGWCLSEIGELVISDEFTENYYAYVESYCWDNTSYEDKLVYTAEEFSRRIKVGSYIVEDSNEYFSVKDGILYSKDGRGLLAYPMGSDSNLFIYPDVDYASPFTFTFIGEGGPVRKDGFNIHIEETDSLASGAMWAGEVCMNAETANLMEYDLAELNSMTDSYNNDVTANIDVWDDLYEAGKASEHLCNLMKTLYKEFIKMERSYIKICTSHEEPATEEPATEEPTTEEPTTEEPSTEEPTTEEPTTEDPTTEDPTTSGTSGNVVSGTCGDNLTWSLDTQTGLLEISGTGAMYDYDSFGNLSPWCEYISDIKSVIIGEGVTSIGVGAFINCYNLTDISIANSVISIGANAFECCQSLETINLPTNLKSIGNEAFDGCCSIRTITIPKSVTNIGEFAFIGCSSLTSITVDEENSIYSSDSLGVLFDKKKTKLIKYPTGSNMISYTVPDSVTEIQGYAFANGSALKEVTVSDAVTIIGAGAFSHCFGLTDFIIPKGVSSIGESTFYNCRNLGDIIIPDSITRIGGWAFYNCDSLMNITIPDGVVSIEEGAFMYCSSLTDVTIGKDVASIGKQAFVDCTSLTNIKVDGENKHYSNDQFGVLFNKNKSELIQYPIGSTRNNYIIPDSVMSIGDYAFLDCRSLTSVTIPNSVTNIGDEVFYFCYNIEYLHIPTSVITIGDEAFYYGANYICSATENCFAQIYAKENDIEFKVCTGHDEPEHIHTPKKITVPASCTVDGMEYTVCAECGEPTGEVTVIPAAHTPGEWETMLEPTAEADGKKVKKCTVCGDVLEEKAIPRLDVATSVDEKTGIEMEYVVDDYDGEVKIKAEEAFDGTAFDVIDTNTNSTQKFIYDITMTVNGVEVQPNGKVTVRIPLPAGYDPERTFVYHVNTETSELEKMSATYADGYMVFETTHFSYYALVEVLDVELKINNTSTNIINYGETLVLQLGEIEIPEGYAIAWFVEGAGVSTWVSEDGLECRVTSIANGNPTIYAKLVDEEENVITNADGEEIFDEITLVSKAGFWQKFISFFKNLFGINRVIY